MSDADTESNLLQVELGNRQPNAWSASLFPVTLVQGTVTYTLPASLIAIRDAYITVSTGGIANDRVIWPLSTQEYDAIPNKTIQAVPTSFWMNRLIVPTVSVWPVPDGNATYTLNLRILSQIQDTSQANGTNLNMPYRFLDVYVAGLAHRLSRIYAPDKTQELKADYMEAWANAAAQDLDDNVMLVIGPDFSGYTR